MKAKKHGIVGCVSIWFVFAQGCIPNHLHEQVGVSTLSDREQLARLFTEERKQVFLPAEGTAFSPKVVDTSTTTLKSDEEEYLWLTQKPYAVEPILSLHPDSYDLPQSQHPSVEMWIQFLQGRGRKWYELWLARSTRYVPIFYSVLDESDLPRDLVFLAMVESGFSPRAFSSAAAAGPWQFIPKTGRRYGLRIGFWVDERRDFEKATIAAARHLRWLYSRYGDWLLAMAAYNAGAGRVSSALKRSRTSQFWDLYKTRWIRRETKHYVPKILAAAIISKNPEKYGFNDISYQPPMAYDTINVHDSVSLKTIGEACGGVEQVALEELNPSLRVSVTPPKEPWEVRVPPGLGDRCEEGLQALTPLLGYTFRYCQPSMGESLTDIASKCHTDPQAILGFHGVVEEQELGYYPEMAVPVRLEEADQVAIVVPDQRERSARYQASVVRVTRYVTQKGDSMRKVARRFGVSMNQLRKWNQLSRSSVLPLGRVLMVYTYPTPKKTRAQARKSRRARKHRVRKGESLWVIARRYDTSLEKLCRLNGIRPGQSLRIGQILRTR